MKNAKIVFHYLLYIYALYQGLFPLEENKQITMFLKKCLFGSENNFHMQIIVHVQDELFVKTFHHINHLCA